MSSHRALASLRSNKAAVPDLSQNLQSISFVDGPNQKQVSLLPPKSNLSIDKGGLALLREKQARLKSTKEVIEEELPQSANLRRALLSTLIFAQYEAGTAVCVDSTGLILTCAHCFGETLAEYRANKRKWLLFYTGQAVLVECCAWDPKRDLALGKIIAVECEDAFMPATQAAIEPVFASIRLPAQPPSLRASIVCIGQPGRDDLESTSERKTTYNLVEVSEGRLKGMVKDADPQDNSDIGSLKHNAWTYWGHSGAPLVGQADGVLVGLHSSWDDETAMRHGIPWVAIREFLTHNGISIGPET